MTRTTLTTEEFDAVHALLKSETTEAKRRYWIPKITAAHTLARNRRIMRLLIAGGLTQREIGERFGITETAVKKIKQGTLGKRHTEDLRALLPPSETKCLRADTIRAIYVAAWNGIPQADISQQYDVSLSMISAIKHRKKHGKHTMELERERKAKLKGASA